MEPKEAKAILDKLYKKASVTDDELESLQQHIDILERAAAGSHHHDHDSKVLARGESLG